MKCDLKKTPAGYYCPRCLLYASTNDDRECNPRPRPERRKPKPCGCNKKVKE